MAKYFKNLLCKILGKVSGSLGRSQGVKAKDRNHCWMCAAWESGMPPCSVWPHCHLSRSTAASRNTTWNWIQLRGCHFSTQRYNATKFSGHELISEGHKNSCSYQRWKRPSRLSSVTWRYLMQRCVLELQIDMWAHQGDMFTWEFHGYLSWTASDLILSNFRQSGFIDSECVCFTDPPAVHICLLLKMYGASCRRENNNRRRLSSWNLGFSWNRHRFLWKTATICIK